MAETKDYFIEIEFNEEGENSIEILKSTIFLLKGIQNLNNAIVHTIDNDISAYPALMKIEEGSIRIWLKDKLEKVPDEKIKAYVKNPKEAISDLLIASKYKAIQLLDDKSIKKPGQIEEKLNEIIETELLDTGLHAYGYTLQPKDGLKALGEISQGVKLLSHKTSINFTNYSSLNISPDFEYESSLNSHVHEHTIKKTLTIKKPDLVGKSRWTFVDNKIIEAEITDIEWITRLRNREFSISSGDMIEVDLRVQTISDINNNKEIHYFIDKVYNKFAPSNPQEYLEGI